MRHLPALRKERLLAAAAVVLVVIAAFLGASVHGGWLSFEAGAGYSGQLGPYALANDETAEARSAFVDWASDVLSRALSAADDARTPSGRRPLGAFYQCHKRSRSFNGVLRRFRMAYPTAPLVVVNDGGDQALRAIALKYNANYSYEGQVAVPGRGALYMSGDAAAVRLVERAALVANEVDWIMLLEDDVNVRRPVNLTTLTGDLNGDNPKEFLSASLVTVIQQELGRPVPDTHFGGAGGGILRAALLREIVASAGWKDRVKRLAKARGSIASDELWSSLVLMSGGRIASYPGYVEAWYPDALARLEAGTCEVLHKDKSLYDDD